MGKIIQYIEIIWINHQIEKCALLIKNTQCKKCSHSVQLYLQKRSKKYISQIDVKQNAGYASPKVNNDSI